jgi:hypothetical protein
MENASLHFVGVSNKGTMTGQRIMEYYVRNSVPMPGEQTKEINLYGDYPEDGIDWYVSVIGDNYTEFFIQKDLLPVDRCDYQDYRITPVVLYAVFETGYIAVSGDHFIYFRISLFSLVLCLIEMYESSRKCFGYALELHLPPILFFSTSGEATE